MGTGIATQRIMIGQQIGVIDETWTASLGV